MVNKEEQNTIVEVLALLETALFDINQQMGLEIESAMRKLKGLIGR